MLIEQMFFEQMFFEQMFFEQMFFEQMLIEQMFIEQMFIKQMSIEQMCLTWSTTALYNLNPESRMIISLKSSAKSETEKQTKNNLVCKMLFSKSLLRPKNQNWLDPYLALTSKVPLT